MNAFRSSHAIELTTLLVVVIWFAQGTHGSRLLLQYDFDSLLPSFSRLGPRTHKLELRNGALLWDEEGAKDGTTSLLVNNFTQMATHSRRAKTMDAVDFNATYFALTLWYKSLKLGGTDHRLIHRDDDTGATNVGIELALQCEAIAGYTEVGVSEACEYRLRASMCEYPSPVCDPTWQTFYFNAASMKPYAGEWVFLAVAIDFRAVRVYHRPTSVADFESSALPFSGNGKAYSETPGQKLAIGNHVVDSWDRGFFGLIDDVRFYELDSMEEFTLNEARSIYNQVNEPVHGTTSPTLAPPHSAPTVAPTQRPTLAPSACEFCFWTLELFNITTDSRLEYVYEGAANVYELDSEAEVSVRAITGTQVEAVRYDLTYENGTHIRTYVEKLLPYTLYGDPEFRIDKSNPWPWEYNVVYLINATGLDDAEEYSSTRKVHYNTSIMLVPVGAKPATTIADIDIRVSDGVLVTSTPATTVADIDIRVSDGVLVTSTAVHGSVDYVFIVVVTALLLLVAIVAALVCVCASHRRRARRQAHIDAVNVRSASLGPSKRSTRPSSRAYSRSTSKTMLRRGPGAPFAPGSPRFTSSAPRNAFTPYVATLPVRANNQYDSVGDVTTGNYESMTAPLEADAANGVYESVTAPLDGEEQTAASAYDSVPANTYSFLPKNNAPQYDQVHEPL